MHSHDSPTFTSPPNKSGFTRYLVPLVLLVVIIGGIAWIAQNLPHWKKAQAINVLPQGKAPLEFPRKIAQWGPRGEKGAEEKFPPKDYEPATKGHYDFLFKNVANEDVEVVFFSSSCDCTSVQACALSAEEWKRLNEQQDETPAEPLHYADKIAWKELIKETEWTHASASDKKEKSILVKPGDGGAVRVSWEAKTAGSPLKVLPKVWFRPARGNVAPSEQLLAVPLMVAQPVRFQPQRLIMDALTAGTSTKKEFYAWSSTRDHVDVKLSAGPNDTLFEVESTPVRVGGIFSRSDCADLISAVEQEKSGSRVRSAQRVTLIVHESKGNQYLDLGTYHRKLTVKLDGFPVPDLQGPEVLGRVHGDISIGGADDQARVRLKAFAPADGATRTVELAADARWQLETYKHEPPWVQVKLTRDAKQADAKRAIWRLTVTVPENAPGVRSLEDPDAVLLRIVGPPERLMRIPIEGQMTGGR